MYLLQRNCILVKQEYTQNDHLNGVQGLPKNIVEKDFVCQGGLRHEAGWTCAGHGIMGRHHTANTINGCVSEDGSESGSRRRWMGEAIRWDRGVRWDCDMELKSQDEFVQGS